MSAGDATNVVTDYVHIKGEARSPDLAFAHAITEGFREAFQKAQRQIKDAEGATAQVKFEASHAYPPFNLANDMPVVRHAIRAAESLGMKPSTVFSNGGLDANWLVKHGLPTVSIGAGQNEVHTVKVYVDLPEFANGCRLAVAMATREG
jgi:tripeptide aminopeptidase